MKVIIDFDGTLTREEDQATALAEASLDTLAAEILHEPRRKLAQAYAATQARLLSKPHAHWWEVSGLIASYCDEGAFILNTTTLQVMLRQNNRYLQGVTETFPDAEYDPVIDCTNYLFHRHTAELPPAFRPGARAVLVALAVDPHRQPLILTNSLDDKVSRLLATLNLPNPVSVLGDTRQYAMDPSWSQRFSHPQLGQIQVWPVDDARQVDLRRPAYYHALQKILAEAAQIAVVADTLSLPGALPLMMGLPFFLLRTAYTPAWCARAVEKHPQGRVLEDITELPAALEQLEDALPPSCCRPHTR